MREYLICVMLLLGTLSEIGKANAPVGPEGREIQAHYDEITGLAFSPDGKLLVSASVDGTICFWDVHERENLVRLECIKAECTGSRSPAMGRRSLRGADNLARLWDVKTRKEVRQLKGHKDKVASVAFSPNVRIVATGSYDKTIRLWDSATGREVGRLQGHDARVTAVAFSPDGKQLASGGTGESVINLPRGGVLTTAQDDFVRLWDVSSGKQLRKLPDAGAP